MKASSLFAHIAGQQFPILKAIRGYQIHPLYPLSFIQLRIVPMKSLLNKFRVASFYVLIICLNSCAPAYVPNMVNQPLLHKEGDLKVSVSSGSSGFDPQIAYAVTNQIGIMANGSFAHYEENNQDNTSTNNHKHQFFEFGSGYYEMLNPITCFEVYGGYGLGSVNGNYSDLWESHSDSRINRLFIQPGVGITNDFIDASFSPRIVWVDIIQSGDHVSQLLFEPALTAKFGYKHVKGIFQIGFSGPIGQDHYRFLYQPFMLSVGIQGSFGKKTK
jgi:hypothetical protein